VEAVAAFAEKMAAREVACAPLQTSHAFHSAMMQPVVEPFTAAAAKLRLQAPKLPLVSTLTGANGGDFTAPEYWARQLREPVRFAQAVKPLAKITCCSKSVRAQRSRRLRSSPAANP
jgi:acyl transferase domain-containing protein